MLQQKIINVASVPQRSPFRYPGGKTWLVPYIRAWIKSLKSKPTNFVEPFVGGGIISLTVAFEDLADHVIMVELDEQVAAVWKAILGGHAKWLAKKITEYEITLESVKAELDKSPQDLRALAFQTILKNRVHHGGIMAFGSSVIRHGENGKGITSRWYPATLKRRILDIASIGEKIEFIEGDGMKTIKKHALEAETAFFVDPPYTAAGKKAGKRLYKHNELDHEQLFELMSDVKGNFLMTYDHADGVLRLAKRHNFDTEVVAMKNTHHAQMTEMLISRDLEWLRKKKKGEQPRLLFD